MGNLWRCWGSLSWCLTGQLVSGEVTSLGVSEALENDSGQEQSGWDRQDPAKESSCVVCA